MQNDFYSSSLTVTNMVFRGSIITCLSYSSSSTLSKLLTQAKESSTSNLPSRLGVIKKSVRDRNFAQCCSFYLQIKQTSIQKVYDAKCIVYTCLCHRKEIIGFNPVFSELIRCFELQRTAQGSSTP